MECRRTAAATASGAGGILRPALTAHRPRSRRHTYDCDDHDDEFNNNNNVTATTSCSANTTTTLLVDELEQLRTDNFQLRLRVYNAERRVDRLSEAVTHDRGRRKRTCVSGGDSDSSNSSGGSSTCSSTSGGDDTAVNTRTVAAATATAEAAVRTIHDLLTVNRRLLALLAAAVSAKAVAVTPSDKRRWRRLRNHINEHAGDQVGGYSCIEFIIFENKKVFFFLFSRYILIVRVRYWVDVYNFLEKMIFSYGIKMREKNRKYSLFKYKQRWALTR